MDQDAAMILLTCLSYSINADKEAALFSVTAEEWRKVVDLAHQHKVAPLLYYHIRRLKVTLPGELFNELEQAHGQNTFRNMRLYQELHKLLSWLQAEEIPVIVLKGAYLARAVYESVGLRTMGDIDILVRQEDVMRLGQELLGWGYVPTIYKDDGIQDIYDYRYTLERINCIIEIHRDLMQKKYPFRINLEGLWERAEPLTLSQTQALVFSPEDLLLHLCLHAVKHTFRSQMRYEMRIRTLCDIGEVVRCYGLELDWQGLGNRAMQYGGHRAVYLILRLAKDLLRADVPGNWLESFKPVGFNEHFFEIASREYIIARIDGDLIGSEKKQAARLFEQIALAQKLGLIFESIFQSRESMATMYPVSANSWRIYLYYPVHVKDLLIRHIPIMWRLARGDQEINTQIERTNQLITLLDWLMSS